MWWCACQCWSMCLCRFPSVCVFFFVSPLSTGSLSEVLLSKLQHVIFTVQQGPLIQISITKAIKGNFLKGKSWQWNNNLPLMSVCVCVHEGTSIVWSISCAAIVDATATATADDTANCPAPPRGSDLRSSGSDRKSGGATGWTYSAGNAAERPNTEPNFQPDTDTQIYRAEALQHAAEQLSPLKSDLSNYRWNLSWYSFDFLNSLNV